MGVFVFWLVGPEGAAVEGVATAALWGLLAAVGLIVAVFIVNLFLAPPRLYFALEQRLREQSSEAKATIDQLNIDLEIREGLLAAKSKRLFADVEIEIEPAFCLDLREDTEPPAAEIALIFNARVTNREPSQRVNLTFDMHLIWEVGRESEGIRNLESRLFATRQTTSRKYEQDLFPSVLELDAGHTKKGFLSFNHWSTDPKDDRWITFSDWNEGEGPIHFLAREGHKFRLTVHDYITSQTITFDVPAIWPPREETA